MKHTAIILLIVSHHGYWFGGQTSILTVSRAARVPVSTNFVWELMYGTAKLASGELSLPPEDRPGTISITLPPVRVPTEMRIVYRVRQASNEPSLEGGEIPLHIYPQDLLSGTATRLAGRRVTLWERGEELSTLLSAARITVARVNDGSALRLANANVILVGPDVLEDRPFEQSVLLEKADQGANVLVLRQARVMSLARYPLYERQAPPNLRWQEDHPLARHASLWNDPDTERTFRAIQLPADEPALEIGFWPREAPGRQPVPIDAILATKAIGRGRIVLCQFPLAAWRHDPRSQLLLGDLLDYAVSRPEPTPRPSQRPQPKTIPTQTVPTIPICDGDPR